MPVEIIRAQAPPLRAEAARSLRNNAISCVRSTDSDPSFDLCIWSVAGMDEARTRQAVANLSPEELGEWAKALVEMSDQAMSEKAGLEAARRDARSKP